VGNSAESAGGALFLVNVAFNGTQSNFTDNIAKKSGSAIMAGNISMLAYNTLMVCLVTLFVLFL
jgi:predicted outer membrane repeat protein